MLSLILPFPQRVRLAGRWHRLAQLQLYDLAYLELWATGGPAQAHCDLIDILAEPDESQRHAGLRQHFDAIETGRNTVGHPSWTAAIATPAGRTVALWRSIRKCRQPGTRRRGTRRQAVALAESLTDAEWSVIDAVIWAQDALDATAAAIDRELGLPPAPVRSEFDIEAWSKTLAVLAKGMGWTPRQLARLTLSQWRALCVYMQEDSDDHPIDYRSEAHPLTYSRLADDPHAHDRARKRLAFWSADPSAPKD